MTLTKLNRTLASVILAFAAVLGYSSPSLAQTTVTQTTFSSAVALPTQTAPARVVVVASASGISAGSELFADEEAMLVTAVNGTQITVQRGVDGSTVGPHTTTVAVYAGPASGVTGSPFVFIDPPVGTCTLANELYSLRINTISGRIWQCTNSTWMNVIDSYAWVGPGNCAYSTSGGTLTAPTFGAAGNTALGLINASGVGIPVYQIATTNSGTATNTISCLLPVPSRTNTSRGAYVVDATFFYGVQQTGLGTQVAVLASGTMNGVAVFQTITLPTPAASETPSAAVARWDSGSLTITPVVASSNVATTTAGQFYSVKFTPANPLAMTTDLTNYYVNLTLLCSATSATTINTPGVLVHYRQVGDL